MAKKFGKFLLFTAVAGAAVYGAYQYLQNKERSTVLSGDDEDDDFDDFSEDLDEDLSSANKERSYVSLNLDKAEAFAAEAFNKAKEVITDSVQQVKETVLKSTTPSAAPATEEKEEKPEAKTQEEAEKKPEDNVEEFFNDEPEKEEAATEESASEE